MVVGANQGNEEETEGPPPARAGKPLDRTSFLARIIPARQEERPAVRGPTVPRSVADLARRLPLERKVAQLFLFGFEGTDLTAEIYRRLRRQDLGGIVLAGRNYTGDPSLLGQLGGEAAVIASQEGHVSPWVLAVQDGGEFNELEGLPPALAGADLASTEEAAIQATETARTLRDLNITGLLGPVVDVGFESGSALGARVYSDDPEEVSAYAEAMVRSLPSGAPVWGGQALPGARRGRTSRPSWAPPASASTLSNCASATCGRSEPPSRPAPRACCSRMRSTPSATSPSPAR